MRLEFKDKREPLVQPGLPVRLVSLAQWETLVLQEPQALLVLPGELGPQEVQALQEQTDLRALRVQRDRSVWRGLMALPEQRG